MIDGDTVAFAPASTAENDELWVATSRANSMLETMLEATGADEFELWLTGKSNFRFSYYPEYKANRIGAPRPKWEQSVKDYLVSEWGARYSEGCEADDMVGALQTSNTMIAHIDKDINMIPGWHFHWGLTRQGKVLVEPHKYYVTPDQADYNFYYQMVIGDPTDNIKGVVGAGPKKAEKILQQADDDFHNDLAETFGPLQLRNYYFDAVRELYSNDAEMDMNGKCLWIWRKINDIWEFPIDTTISESEGAEITTNSP